MLRIAPVLLLAALCLSPASAQEVTGTLSGAIDGEEKTLVSLSDEGESNSFWMEIMPGMYAASIFGHAGAGSLSNATDALELGFKVLVAGDAARVLSISAMHYKSGAEVYFGEADFAGGSDTNVTVTLAEVDGNSLHVQGDFVAKLVLIKDRSTMELDPSQFEAAAGKFDVTLPLRE
jgi:hypothetical protein